jgi:hypothetical protein
MQPRTGRWRVSSATNGHALLLHALQCKTWSYRLNDQSTWALLCSVSSNNGPLVWPSDEVMLIGKVITLKYLVLRQSQLIFIYLFSIKLSSFLQLTSATITEKTHVCSKTERRNLRRDIWWSGSCFCSLKPRILWLEDRTEAEQSYILHSWPNDLGPVNFGEFTWVACLLGYPFPVIFLFFSLDFQ